MLQQQLQQRDEDLAARKAEIGELKERVAELEKMKQQQEQLLTMKDSELAAAQQRLADSRTAASTPATAAAATAPALAPTATQAIQPVPEPKPETPQMVPWLWIGLAVLVIALVAWLLLRRRRSPTVPAQRRSFDSEALADSMRTPFVVASTTTAAEDSADAGIPVAATGARVVDIADPATVTPPRETPTWHSGGWVNADPEPEAPASSSPRFVPPEDQPLAAEPSLGEPPATVPPSAQQRVRLARAFLDIGDEHSAKQLLRELVVDPDPGARAEAAKLLRELD